LSSQERREVLIISVSRNVCEIKCSLHMDMRIKHILTIECVADIVVSLAFCLYSMSYVFPAARVPCLVRSCIINCSTLVTRNEKILRIE
jgi:hypothetical protein